MAYQPIVKELHAVLFQRYGLHGHYSGAESLRADLRLPDSAIKNLVLLAAGRCGVSAPILSLDDYYCLADIAEWIETATQPKTY